MKKIDQWLSEYGESHRNHTNKTIHWICVPLIFFSIIGFLYSIKLPIYISNTQLNAASIASVAITVYYMRLSHTLWIGLFLFLILCFYFCAFIEQRGYTLWLICLVVFSAAWTGQFYGHGVEGKKPSFLKDLQFLMIGPAWLMSFIYAKLNIKI